MANGKGRYKGSRGVSQGDASTSRARYAPWSERTAGGTRSAAHSHALLPQGQYRHVSPLAPATHRCAHVHVSCLCLSAAATRLEGWMAIRAARVQRGRRAPAPVSPAGVWEGFAAVPRRACRPSLRSVRRRAAGTRSGNPVRSAAAQPSGGPPPREQPRLFCGNSIAGHQGRVASGSPGALRGMISSPGESLPRPILGPIRTVMAGRIAGSSNGPGHRRVRQPRRTEHAAPGRASASCCCAPPCASLRNSSVIALTSSQGIPTSPLAPCIWSARRAGAQAATPTRGCWGAHSARA
jgi:hypothetical protein